MKRVTIRARLVLVYSGLLFLAGALLLAVMYILVSRQLRPERALGPDGPDLGDAASSGAMTLMRYLHDDTLPTLLTQGAVALLVISGLAVGLGWLIAGRLLQPLQRVTETARRIGEAADRRLHERIALVGPYDEVKELADTFDVMLERLDQSFGGQRRFIANASHELRTPLAVNRALLEVAVSRQGASADTRHLGETLLEINDRHERLIEGLLLLARADQEVVERSFVDLGDLARHVTGHLPPSTVPIRVDLGEAATMGSAILLERAIRNLVENAVRYNVAEDGWVSVETRTGPDRETVVEVANTGPVVSKHEIPVIFEPFRRLANDRIVGRPPGSGSLRCRVTAGHGGDQVV
jgi:signal transduction histidine kinase